MTTNSLFDNAIIKVELSDGLYKAWVAGGKGGSGITFKWETKMRYLGESSVTVPVIVPILVINSKHALINNIQFNGQQEFPIYLQVIPNPLKVLSMPDNLSYHLSHYEMTSSGEVPIGGEEFIFSKKTPGGLSIHYDLNTSTVITAKFAVMPNPSTGGEFTLTNKNPQDIDMYEVTVKNYVGTIFCKNQFSSTTFISANLNSGSYILSFRNLRSNQVVTQTLIVK